MSDNAPDPVAAQYADYPYPARDPRDEAKRLITGSPSHLAELTHHGFGGALPAGRSFRALIAGGGTGDGAVMLAQQLAGAGADASVLHLDLSAASQAVARARAEARGLSNIAFVQGSLLDAAALDGAPFDYIDCCGVLHHLEDPAAGLAALKAALRPEGAMGLMVYGALGRTGVYPAQDMLRRLAPPSMPPADRLAAARRLLKALPQSNWLRRNPYIGDHLDGGDAGLFDLLLHARDRAYQVTELAALVDGAGLRIAAFIDPARYDPDRYLADPALRRGLADADATARAAFAEQLAGDITKHVVYAVAAENPITPPDPADDGLIPVFRDDETAAAAAQIKAGDPLALSLGGHRFRLPLPRLAPAILARIDGHRSVGEIHQALCADTPPGPPADAYGRAFTETFNALNGFGKLFLRRP